MYVKTNPNQPAGHRRPLPGLPAWTGLCRFTEVMDAAQIRNVIGRSNTANHQSLIRPQAKPPAVLSIVRLVFGA